MKKVELHFRIAYIICAAMIIIAGIFHYVDEYVPIDGNRVHLEVFSFLFFLAVAVIFQVLHSRLVVNRVTRLYINIATGFICFWILLCIIEKSMVAPGTDTDRFLIYFFYVPAVCVMLFSMMAFSNNGFFRSVRNKVIVYGVCIAAGAVLLALVLTNDLHELFFGFPLGKEHFVIEDNAYYNGPVAFMVIGYILFLALFSFLVLARKHRLRKLKGNMAAPVIGILFALAYGFGSAFDMRYVWIWNQFYEFPETFAILYFFIVDSLSRSGLLHTNFSGKATFEASTLQMSIIDRNGNVKYHTREPELIDPALRKKAENTPVMVTENHKLQARPVNGGYILWIDDLTSINGINRDLRKISGRLQEENDLINAENELSRRRAAVNEQQRLYDMLDEKVRPELDAIGALLESMDPDSPEIRQQFAKACVLKAYVKRVCNLLLLKENGPSLQCFELENSIRESMDYLSMTGVSCALDSSVSGSAPADAILTIFDVYEKLAESATQSQPAGMEELGCALNVELSEEGGELSANMRLASKCGLRENADYSGLIRQAEQMGGSVYGEKDAENTFVGIRIPMRGGVL